MAFGGQHLFEYALGVLELDRIHDRFLRNTNSAFAEGLKDIGFRHALQAFELDVPNDRQLLDFENHSDTTTRGIFDRDPGADLVEKAQGKNSLQVTPNLGFVVDIARSGL